MREIEFRGKDVNSKRWVYGYLTKTKEFNAANDADLYSLARTIIHDDYLHDVIPETVGQYTGLKDKNGVKIFEGDILSDNKRAAVVIWGDSFDSPARFLTSRTLSPKDICIGNTRWDMCEVIGNYHDNPELLKEADNG